MRFNSKAYDELFPRENKEPEVNKDEQMVDDNNDKKEEEIEDGHDGDSKLDTE